MSRSLLVVLLAGCGAAHGPTSQPATATGPRAFDHVVVVTVDGMRPEVYASPEEHGLRVPTLRRMAAEGAAAPEGVQSVFPTLTYPAHTSIMTGARPVKHGIYTNVADDPAGKNLEGWRWYREDVRLPTIDAVATRAGLITADIDWPVTVGARTTFLLPEYWRAKTPEDVKLSRALATAGLLDDVARRFPDFPQGFTPPDVKDSATLDAVVTLIERDKPNLIFLHIWETDDAQHAHGPFSPEANAAFENADTQLARLEQALRAAGIWERSVIIVTSDHGFAAIDKHVKPAAMLAQAGIKPTRAWVAFAGGTAFVYQANPEDLALRPLLLEIFLVAPGIARVLDRAEIAREGGDPRALLALVCAPGYGMLSGAEGPAVVPAQGRGTHGYPPEDPDMRASLLIYGPRIAPQAIENARLIDIAPTIAMWLRLSLPDAEGHALPLRLR